MSCEFGYQGECCCECDYQIPLHVCNCGHCSTVEGWICTIFYYMSQADGEQGVMIHMPKKHGCCEMYKKRKNYKKEPTDEEDKFISGNPEKLNWEAGIIPLIHLEEK